MSWALPQSLSLGPLRKSSDRVTSAFFNALSRSYKTGAVWAEDAFEQSLVGLAKILDFMGKKRFRYFDRRNSPLGSGIPLFVSSVSAAATNISSSETLSGSQRSIHLIRLRQVSMEIPILRGYFPSFSDLESFLKCLSSKSPQFRHFSISFALARRGLLNILPATRVSMKRQCKRRTKEKFFIVSSCENMPNNQAQGNKIDILIIQGGLKFLEKPPLTGEL